MHVNVMETATGLLVEADVNRDMYETATVRRWLESFGELLQAAVAQPTARIDQLSMVSARATAIVCCASGIRRRETFPTDRLLHEMVEAHAARTPQSLALVDGERRLTWQQLTRRANQIAHALVRRGVTRGSVVGLGLERSADFIASMLAAHKAGAAYVPLDIDLSGRAPELPPRGRAHQRDHRARLGWPIASRRPGAAARRRHPTRRRASRRTISIASRVPRISPT